MLGREVVPPHSWVMAIPENRQLESLPVMVAKDDARAVATDLSPAPCGLTHVCCPIPRIAGEARVHVAVR